MLYRDFQSSCEPDKLFEYIQGLTPAVSDRKWWFMYTNGVVASRMFCLQMEMDLRRRMKDRELIRVCLCDGYMIADGTVMPQAKIAGCETAVDHARWILSMKSEDLFVGVAPVLCDIIRDVVDPFHCPVFNKTDSQTRPSWVTDDAFDMAVKIRESWDPDTGELDADAMMVVSDALEEAGCRHSGLLNHLRGRANCSLCSGFGRVIPDVVTMVEDVCLSCGGTGLGQQPPHLMGCWAIEFLIGKE